MATTEKKPLIYTLVMGIRVLLYIFSYYAAELELQIVSFLKKYLE